MNKLFLATAFVALSIILNACHDASSSPSRQVQEVIPVKIIQLQQQTVQQEIQASGQFTTEDETLLSFKTGGIVNQVFVHEGDAIRKGQLLATLHLTEVNAQEQQAKYSYEKSLRDYNRYRQLYTDSVTTLEQLQNAQTALNISLQQLNAIRFNQSYSEIRAAASGFVLKKFVNGGQMVNAGDPILQVNGARQTAWILKVGVSDKDWSAIKPGNKAIVQTDAIPGNPIEAVVLRKSESIDPATGTFTVCLQIKSKNMASIAAGLFGKATIYPPVTTAAWTIPYDALIDGDASGAYAFVTNDCKTATKVKVKVAAVQKGNVTISSGLETARALIVSGNAYLKEDVSIKVVH